MSDVKLECPNCFREVAVTRNGQRCVCGHEFRIGDKTIFQRDEIIAAEIQTFRSSRDSSLLSNSTLVELGRRLLLTTETAPEGLHIVERLGVVSAECVQGIGIFKDLAIMLSDAFGGRSATYEKTLRSMRETCFNEIRAEAARMGADAVIGLQLSFNQIAGKQVLMVFLVATGTAVRLGQTQPP